MKLGFVRASVAASFGRCAAKRARGTGQRGALGRGDVITIEPELSNPNCTLRALARSHTRAFARVSVT